MKSLSLHPDGLEIRVPASKNSEWELVLLAVEIPFNKSCSPSECVFNFQSKEQARDAFWQIEQYEKENETIHKKKRTSLEEIGSFPIWVPLALYTFFVLSWIKQSHSYFLEKGNVFGQKIIAGEWWRIFTGLTLHVDFFHLISNIVTGVIFVSGLQKSLGRGFSWFLILSTGALGNLINTLYHPHYHRSVGASTAIFACIGLLAALQFWNTEQKKRKKWAALLSSFAFLAFFGAGGKRTDLGAHLWGLISGIFGGLPVGYFFYRLHKKPSRPWQFILGGLSILILGASWFLALKN